jgi:hypothetical protein
LGEENALLMQAMGLSPKAGSSIKSTVGMIRGNNFLVITISMTMPTSHHLPSPKNYKKSDLPSKICIACLRPFSRRKKWERCRDEIRFCSEKCKKMKSQKKL